MGIQTDAVCFWHCGVCTDLVHQYNVGGFGGALPSSANAHDTAGRFLGDIGCSGRLGLADPDGHESPGMDTGHHVLPVFVLGMRADSTHGVLILTFVYAGPGSLCRGDVAVTI